MRKSFPRGTGMPKLTRLFWSDKGGTPMRAAGFGAAWVFAFIAAALMDAQPAWTQPAAPAPYDVIGALAAHNPDYPQQRRAWRARLKPLAETIARREAAGEPMVCANQILAEARWLVAYTTDTKRVERRLTELADEAGRQRPTQLPDRPAPPDGYWASCHEADFFRLSVSYDGMVALAAKNEAPSVKPGFLDRYNDHERLRREFLGLMTSDPARSGESQRRALIEVVPSVVNLVLRDQPTGYQWNPNLKTALRGVLIDDMRDPVSGFWGARFVDGESTVRTADLGLTFSIVRALRGDVPDWPRLLDTTLAIRDLRYPYGWRSSVGQLNQNNYEVAELFRLGWGKARDDQKAAIRGALADMLAWTLSQSLQGDATFKVTEDDDTVESANFFGTAFLVSAGYFDKKKRYWTDLDFPQAEATRQKLLARASQQIARGAGGSGGYYYRRMVELLQPAS